MTINDFLSVVTWWTVLLSIGTIFAPLNTFLFRNFFDKGYIFSKVLGVGILSYTIFLLATLHILAFTQFSLIGILIFFAGLECFIIYKQRTKKRKSLKEFFFTPTTALIIVEEFFFFTALLFWAFVRAHQPDIHGLEKYMDFGFLNSILRSSYFPAQDMWYPPYPINYYYFGHLVTAVLTKLSDIPSPVTFNLMLATLFSFTFVGAFSLIGNIWSFFLKKTNSKKRILLPFLISGILAGFILSSSGNLHTVYSFFLPYQNDYPKPLWDLKFSPTTFPNAYWYPNATRYIYHTIHEFPLYSFVVSDLHGHVIDIPFVLLLLALLFSFVIYNKEDISSTNTLLPFAFAKKLGNHIPMLILWIFIGWLLAIMYMTNALDGLIYLLLSILTCWFIYKKYFDQSFLKTIIKTPLITTTLILFISFLLFSLPFSLFFKSFVSEIGLVCPPQFLITIGRIGPFVFEANHCDRSPWWQLLTLYGFFTFWSLSLIVFLLKKKKEVTDSFMFLLIGFAYLLIIIPEFFYLRDIYTTFYRANTMFKLVYQSFMILSLVSVYSLARIFSLLKFSKNIFKSLGSLIFILIGLLLFILVSIYPYFAIGSYYDNLKHYYGLNGTSYLQTLYPGDASAIEWIQTHITNQPVMLEAQGDSYTDYERISADTGLPTPLGWTVHEWLWRGTYDVVPPRQSDIQLLYQTTDVEQAKLLIQKYHISYVYVGGLEREKYPTLSEEKFATIGRIVYQNNGVTIYQVSL